MRILLLCNNWIGWQIAKLLQLKNENIVGLVIHPKEKQKYTDEIIKTLKIKSKLVFDGSKLKEKDTFDNIKDLKPDIGISILFDYILNQKFIDLFNEGIINLHPSYLPYNRGQYPNVWSIIDNTPAGVTLHYIDKTIDTGDIIEQELVEVEPIDTGKTLYKKLEKTAVSLFKKSWPKIKTHKTTPIKQSKTRGSYYRKKDVEKIDKIDLNKKYTAKELINIIRARTYYPYKGAYFDHNGKKIYLKLSLEYEK